MKNHQDFLPLENVGFLNFAKNWSLKLINFTSLTLVSSDPLLLLMVFHSTSWLHAVWDEQLMVNHHVDTNAKLRLNHE